MFSRAIIQILSCPHAESGAHEELADPEAIRDWRRRNEIIHLDDLALH